MIVLTATLASGCAASGFDAGSLQRHLVAAGVRPAAARCVADHMAATFGGSRLGARVDPTAAELRAERSLLHECGATVPKTAPNG